MKIQRKGQSNNNNSYRIAKNTFVLYFRMLFLMLIGLYTSRVVLKTLGVEDYGTYNVVGGIVSMFSLLTYSVSSAISRYLTFELGKDDKDQLNKVFSTSINVLLFLSVCVVVLSETVGIWFLNTQMNIPQDRILAANWVMQCAIASFVLGLLMLPYNAALIAHENMNIFAYISILEAVLKLAIVFALYISPYDKLITYAILLFAVSCLIRWIYAAYCRRHYQECRFHYVYDKGLIKEMAGFAGWSFLGDGSWVINVYGVNILINIFFGVALNAARGIASQIDGLVQQFVRNFITAVNPQITKSYAAGDLDYMHKLVFAGAKYSFFMIMLFAIPICLETEILLTIWLGDGVPPYTVAFVQLTLLSTMCISLGNTIITAVSSTGKIKNYQLVVGLVALSNFPITWIAFILGASPIAAYLVNFCIYFLLIFIRLFMAKSVIHIPVQIYLRDVVLKSFFVAIVALSLPSLILLFLEDSILRLILICVISTISSIISIYCIGLSSIERLWLVKHFRNKLNI